MYGNYFSNTPGLRIFGDDHVIFSNYFENCSTALDIGNGDGEVADGAALTSHDRPDRILIAFNTLVNCSSNFKQGGRTGGLGATFVTVTNNIVTGRRRGGFYCRALYQPGMERQYFVQCKRCGAPCLATGYTITDPMLARDLTGTYHLQPAVRPSMPSWIVSRQ